MDPYQKYTTDIMYCPPAVFNECVSRTDSDYCMFVEMSRAHRVRVDIVTVHELRSVL